MKCKSWSNKINNFVLRRLKSIKVNDQQQHQQQQQYLSPCSTMPAMPKEKPSAVSLSDNNFTELKLKEQQTTTEAVVATTTAYQANSATLLTANITPVNYRLQQQQHRIGCGCSSSSTDVVDSSSSSRTYFLTNGYSSPLAAAATAGVTMSSPPLSTTCCRPKTTQTNGNRQFKATAADNCATMIAAVPNKLTSTPPKKSSIDFIFGKYIGEGSFSIVYLAVDVTTKREYAIKVCEKRHILRERKQEYIRREREVMHMMTNVPGFVNLSCTFQDNRSLYFVMTYAKNGDLLPYINKVGSFDVECTRHYAAEIVLACEQMHRRNVVHRDLKPENILLDENMHTLIADFGSAKILTSEEIASPMLVPSSFHASPTLRQSRATSRHYDDEDEEDTNDTGSDDLESPNRIQLQQQRYQRRRKGSFVGTAQYVSPEVLQNGQITPAADLWALGCIVYQMISGLPPFRGSNDYVIFKEILACNLEFPQGFDKNAEDLVRQLLKIDPEERLGALDNSGHYVSVRSHPFFTGIDFDSIRLQTPPTIYPYLPGVSKDEDFRSHYRVPEHLEPGLDDKQLTRLLGIELGTAMGDDAHRCIEIEQKTVTRNIFDLSETEKQQRLEQQKSDKWHVFADNEVILKKGYINKRKGLFARKRMLLLTTGPRLIYIDPVQMIKKGEIPWSAELRVEPKNFKIFFVHTPNRTYYLEDPEGYSLEWVNAVENMRMFTYKDMVPSMGGQHTTSTSDIKMAST